VKLVINMPFRIDANGPYASSLKHWFARVEKTMDVQCIMPSKKVLSPQELDAFYVTRMEAFQGGVAWAFDERGEDVDSVGLAKAMQRLEDRGCRTLHLCLGAASGLPGVLARSPDLRILRLSQLTFAHELAALIVLEQIYRANSILSGHPYHYGHPSDLMKARARAVDRRLN
jgi:23S rRNA pseudoU1915 N3-methylase RlmH